MEIGKVNVTMTVDELAKVKELARRDKARPFVREKFTTKEGHIDRCPVCGEAIGKKIVFCSKCGQRIDTENIAF